MKEQQRAASSKKKGEKSLLQKKWASGHPKVNQGEATAGKNKVAIFDHKADLEYQLSNLDIPKVIVPKFILLSNNLAKGALVTINNGSVKYDNNTILSNINFNINAGEKVAIIGNNGSGKSTFIKAILGDEKIHKTGTWYIDNNIGYLDQQYKTLDFNESVFSNIANLLPSYSYNEIRKFLNDFLFSENINQLVNTLSGGEKARLSLAKIAAKVPKLLILDEITNNLDLETKTHVTQILKDYSGAILVISHEPKFLMDINITHHLAIASYK